MWEGGQRLGLGLGLGHTVYVAPAACIGIAAVLVHAEINYEQGTV